MTEYLDCIECGAPAIPSSDVVGGHPTWTEDDDERWCPGCGCLLVVYLADDGCEARVAEESGRDWRRAMEAALGLGDDRDTHNFDYIADCIRELGAKVGEERHEEANDHPSTDARQRHGR